MKPLLISLVTLLLAVCAGPCFGMMSIENVTKERAKALGMEIRTAQAGPDAVRIELEFPTTGELKSFTLAEMEYREGTKWISTSLKEEKATEGHIVVSFVADRASLDKITLRVVTRSGERTMTGHDLRVKDFVTPAKVP
jgi:hypothetical protein